MQSGQIFQRKYRIDREIGRGSYGIVYLANDLETRQELAIKVLAPDTRDDGSVRHRLRREAKLAGMLKSPHAVRIHDLCEADDNLYVVMEYLRGRDLGAVLETERKLSPARVADVARQVLHALSESHALGVIHRDLKPHNIFLCEAEQGRDLVKVLDFGIAKVAGTQQAGGLRETTKLTNPRSVLGTPAYMSPEQCRGETLTPASDLYSLGVVLYEMVSGRLPFYDDNPVLVMMMHDNNPVPSLPKEIGATPLGQAILKALSKEPRDRFESAAEFAAALGGPATGASPATAARPATTPQAPGATSRPAAVSGAESTPARQRSAPALPPQPISSGLPVWIWIAGAAALLGLAAVLAWIMQVL